jgi:hypothetical protein
MQTVDGWPRPEGAEREVAGAAAVIGKRVKSAQVGKPCPE